MTPVHRIAFVLPNFGGGGAARVATILCREWAQMGHDVHAITFEEVGAQALYPLDDRIHRRQIGFSVSGIGIIGFATNNFARIFALRRCFQDIEPTCAVAFLLEANVTAVAAARSLRIPVVISERNHPGFALLSKAKSRVRRAAYARASRLCVQTQDIANWFDANYDIKSSVIPNPVDLSLANLRATPAHVLVNRPRLRMISLGRLEPQKGFDRLVDAFAMIASEAPDWDLVVFGEGEKRQALEQRISSHQLENRIFLPGVTREPFSELQNCDLYVHAARYEGYPNAVIEALAAGACVVATNCPGGSSEIIANGEFGILVPDSAATALANGLRGVVHDAEKRLAMARRAPNAVAHLAPDIIARRWINLFNDMAEARPPSSRLARNSRCAPSSPASK